MAPMTSSESSPVRALADEYWEAVLRASPTYATFLGDRRFDTEIEDVSVEAEAEQRARWSELLERVTELDLDAAPLDQRVTRDLLVESLTDAIAHIDHRSPSSATTRWAAWPPSCSPTPRRSTPPSPRTPSTWSSASARSAT